MKDLLKTLRSSYNVDFGKILIMKKYINPKF